MKVCVVGGGHIGTTLVCYIKHYDNSINVSLLTSKPKLFNKRIKCNDWENGFSYYADIDHISNMPSETVVNADVVFIALPHFAVEKAFIDISKYVSDETYIGVVPGGGGCEFFFDKYFKSSQTLFGFQRTPFTAKLEEYGKEANLKSWKPFSVIGTTRQSKIDSICSLIEMCGLKTKKAHNYLSIALTPTNPILHTSRIYEIFGQFDRGYIFDDKQKFYVGWSDEASKTLFDMDRELHILLDEISEIDTSDIRSLKEHYESFSIQEMTSKINSIPTFQTVYAPLIKKHNEEGYISDTNSRFFTEDFPWGLAIFRSYCDIIGTQAETMDKLLKWYSDYMGYEWYVNGQFCGKDLKTTGVVQKYGINSRDELLSYYL